MLAMLKRPRGDEIMGRFDWLTFNKRVYLMLIIGTLLFVIGLPIFILNAPPDIFISQSLPDNLSLFGILMILVGSMILIGTSFMWFLVRDK